MKLILTERIPTLGNVGEIVNVSPGYARNFLIPKKFAILASEDNKKMVDDQKRRLAKKIEEQKVFFSELKNKVDGVELSVEKRVTGSGSLYGTVNSNELSQLLNNKGIEVDRRFIFPENPIKSLGTFDVKVKFLSDLEETFKVTVNQDPLQVEEIKKKKELLEAKKKQEELQRKAKEEEETSEETSEEEI